MIMVREMKNLPQSRVSPEALEQWLREEVAPAYDKMKVEPKRGVSAEKVFADIRARQVQRLKART